MMIPGAGPSANYWVEEFIVWGATIFTAGRDEQLITLPHRKTTSRPQFVSLYLKCIYFDSVHSAIYEFLSNTYPKQ